MKTTRTKTILSASITALLTFGLLNQTAKAGNVYVGQINGTSPIIAVSTDQNLPLNAQPRYSDYTCALPGAWDYYYGNPGDATYVTPNDYTPSAVSDPHGVTRFLPAKYTGCKNDVGWPVNGGTGEVHTGKTLWTLTVCNAGYSAGRKTPNSNIACIPDDSAAAAIDSTNQQGAPLNCDNCFLEWLEQQAPNSTTPSMLRGDPVNAANGNVLQTEQDYQGSGANLLEFTRFYNSGTGFAQNIVGKGWSHNYNYSAVIGQGAGQSVVLLRPDGSSAAYTYDSGLGRYRGPNSDKGMLTGVFNYGSVSSLSYKRQDGTVEAYNSEGKLTSLTFPSGLKFTFWSSGAYLTSVTDNRGHSLSFTYQTVGTGAGLRISQLTAPDGGRYAYGYDAYGRLTSVTYPDGKSRTYGYPAAGDGDASSALTSIVDENNSTFATITYDGLGRATSTQHGSGAELTTFSYAGTSTTVTNSLGVQEVMSFASLVGRPQTQAITTRCDNGCPANGQGIDQFVYDSNGNAIAVINKLGIKTCLAYDTTRNLPTKVVDNLPADANCASALSTPPVTSRVKTYQWHASLAVPLTVTGPLSKVIATYDTAGNKLTETEYETTDTTGASGASASTTGTPRTTTWTYNSQGSVLTVKAPRTDANATTTFAYDTNQNLTSVTSPAGLVTTFGNYDANGRPQLITAPNGLQTTLAYDARGRTASVIAGGATTTYGYDGVGQLTSSVLPSGVTVTFTYDDAHRLIATADSFGNRVDRTLDTEGNVLQETVTGNGSVLALSRQAVYDQLSRATSLIQAQ